MGSRLQCPICSSTFPLESFRSVCRCGSLLDVQHDLPEATAEELAQRFRGRSPTVRVSPNAFPGIWRFRELLLQDIKGPILSLSEGNTPLHLHPQFQRYAGLRHLWLKHEGANPTGSFKDRGMTVAVTVARSLNFRGLLCASTGNTAASLAAYGAFAGIPVFVLAPAGKVAAGKIVQTLAFGARVLEIQGDFDDALKLALALSEEDGLALLNSVNPFRIEGQKTAAFEIAEAFDWDPPDWVVLPAGNLGNISSYGKGFAELHSVGLIRRMPRLAAIQAQGANPFYRSYREGFSRSYSVKAETAATAIRIGNPASFQRAVRAIRETNGVVEQVTDEEIFEAKAVVDGVGIGCEPASAAALAGVRKLRQRGIIGENERVVAVLTGNLLKDPDAVIQRKKLSDRRFQVPSSLRRLQEVIHQQLEQASI